MITRAEVMRRAQTIWPRAEVPYSQTTIHQPDGYRADCSGFVAMCWAIPLAGTWGGPNTVSLVAAGWMAEIRPGDLLPGDAVGLCGPGTAGDDGHIQLFDEWSNTDPHDSHHWVWEQRGGIAGPRRREVDWTSAYRAYRYRDIADGGTTVATTLDTSYPSADAKVVRSLALDIRETASILLDGKTVGGDKPAGLYGIVRDVVREEESKRPIVAMDETRVVAALLGDPRLVDVVRAALTGLDLKVSSPNR